MKHKPKLKYIAAGAAVFAAALALLFAALCLCAAIPNSAIYGNFESSAAWFSGVEPFPFHNGNKLNSIADNYADAILLGVAWHMGDGGWTAAIDTRYNDGGQQGENAGLYRSVVEGAEPNADYTRYWHGGAMFVRLMHLFTDIEGMRAAGFAAALVLAALTMALLYKLGHPQIAAALLISLAAVQVWNIRLSLEYQSVFILAFIMCPAYMLLEKREAALPLLSVAGGAAAAFFDFLTAETLTILLPLMLVTAIRAREGRLGTFRQGLAWVLPCLIGWGLAYAGAFMVKWAAATIVTGENAFALALNSAAERVGIAGLEGQNGGFLPAVTANLTVLFGGTDRVQPVRAMLGTFAALAALGSVWYLFRGKGRERAGSCLLLLLGALVPLRFVALNNHSYLHEFFTYRALASTIFALLMALLLNLPGKRGAGK